MLVFQRGDQIAIGVRQPRSTVISFESHGFSVDRTLQQLLDAGWELVKPTVPE